MKRIISISILVYLFFLTLQLSAEEVCNFKGDLDFLKQVFKLEMDFKEKSQLKTNLNIENDEFYLKAKIEHLKFNNHDFSTELTSQGKIVSQEGSKFLKCSLESKYSLLDFQPFKDIFSDFMINRDSLVISSFRWGSSNIIGDIALSEPYAVNLYAEIKDTDINALAAIIGFNSQDLTLSGFVDGFLRIQGPLSSAKITGQLKASDGNIGNLLYREILVKVEGIYPIINLFDSEIIEEDGIIYKFKGKVNLAEINNQYSGERNIVFSPLTSDDELNWHKWTIRRDKSRENLEFEHRLKSGRPDRLRMRDDEGVDMLGVEQTLKF